MLAYPFCKVFVAGPLFNLYRLPELNSQTAVNWCLLVHFLFNEGLEVLVSNRLNQTHALWKFLIFPETQFFNQQNGEKWINLHVPSCTSSTFIIALLRAKGKGTITAQKAHQDQVTCCSYYTHLLLHSHSLLLLQTHVLSCCASNMPGTFSSQEFCFCCPPLSWQALVPTVLLLRIQPFHPI